MSKKQIKLVKNSLDQPKKSNKNKNLSRKKNKQNSPNINNQKKTKTKSPNIRNQNEDTTKTTKLKITTTIRENMTMIKDRTVTDRKKRIKKMKILIQTIEIMIKNTKKEMKPNNLVK